MSDHSSPTQTWSLAGHTACLGCQTTERKHVAKGYCGPCYRQLPEIKEKQRQALARWRATEHGKASIKAADASRPKRDRTAYNHRPDVVASRREWDARPENRERRRQYTRSERGRANQRVQNYKRRCAKQTYDAVTAAEELAMREAAHQCPLCQAKLSDDQRSPRAKHLDHIVPVAVGGTHARSNLRIICATCNRRRPRDGSDAAGPTELWSVA